MGFLFEFSFWDAHQPNRVMLPQIKRCSHHIDLKPIILPPVFNFVGNGQNSSLHLCPPIDYLMVG